MAKIIKEIAGMKAEAIAARDEARQESLSPASQTQELSNKAEANTATLTQGLSSLSAGLAPLRTRYLVSGTFAHRYCHYFALYRQISVV